MTTRQQIVDEARTFIDVPWVHQGRSRKGIDCAGLLIRTMMECGLPVADMQGYRRTPNGFEFVEHIRNQTVAAPVIKNGSIGIFREVSFPCHTGFFAVDESGNITLIHAYIGLGKVIEEPFIHHLPGQLVEVRDIVGILD